MAIRPEDQVSVNAFFAQVAEYRRAHGPHSTVSYFAVKRGDEFLLMHGRLFLTSVQRPAPLTHFRSANVMAGHFLLSDLGVGPEDVVESLVSKAELSTPAGVLRFPPSDPGQHSAYYTPFHSDGLKDGNRLDALSLTGGYRLDTVRRPQLDWELKAAETPFDSVDELLHEYQLGSLRGDFQSFDILAQHVAEVDFASPFARTKVRPGVILAAGLPTSAASLGYRVFVQGKVVGRATLHGDAMQWVERGTAQHGSAEIEIPDGAVIHCTASYAGAAQHQGWLADPATLQNPQRAVFEAFDPGLSMLREFLDRSGTRGTNARDVETSIAWLLSMLGFRVTHLGGIEQTQDAVDIIATTPRNSFVLVECTTGVLKSDKVALLLSRAEVVRGRLLASGTHNAKVLPAMVTTRPRAEVTAGVEAAERAGVLVLCREQIDRALERTIVLPDADALFADAEQAITRAVARPSTSFPSAGDASM